MENSIKRFLSKVEIDGSGCWLWTAYLNDGYGMFSIANKMRRAHRLSYEMLVGEIPDGMLVLHSCHTKHCVNPNHLRVGTQLENMRDMFDAGRNPVMHGDRNPAAKLTANQVDEIRRIASAGNHSQREIAKKFGVVQGTVSRILLGDGWNKDVRL